MARALDRIAKIRQGNPLDTGTQLGPQNSAQQLQKISSYVDIGRAEGAEVLIGGTRANVGGDFADGYFYEPTVLKGAQQDAGVPGGDLRPGARSDHVHRRG